MTTLRVSPQEAASELLSRRAARRHLLHFTSYTYPRYQAELAHRLLADALNDIVTGDCKRLMVFAPPQHGKEISHDTPVPTPDGWTVHGALRPGDYILGREGQPVQVLVVGPDVMSTHEIEFNDGTVIECHAHHEWLIHSKQRHRIDRVYETKDLLAEGLWTGDGSRARGNRAVFQVDSNRRIEYRERVLPIPPYVLGAWLGDGTEKANCVTCHPDDRAILDHIAELGYTQCVCSTHPITGCGRMYFTKLYADLRDAELLGHKHIPDLYLASSIEQRLDLLAGLLDTDGYVYHRNGRITFSSADSELIRDVTRLIASLGWRVTTFWTEPKLSSSGIQGKKPVCQLTFNPDMKIPCQLERKQNNKITPKQTLRSIRDIRKIKPVPGRCIQVEGGIYLVGDTFIPTHNSELVSVRLPAYWLGKRPDDPIILTSYAASLAHSKSRQAREVVESPEFKALFPDVRTNPASRAVDNWTLDGHRGELVAAGVGGPITGHGALLGLIDDPFENYAQAESATIRESVWQWYRSTFRTRIWEDGAVVLVMCMTGDTPVLMADGTERLLRDVRVGDQVATYDNGKLGMSTVQAHRSNGPDFVYAIRTICGKIVHANARHPFLVEEHGQLKWIRLRNLTTAHKIVVVKDSGASGRARLAVSRAARNQLVHGAIASCTMPRRCGRTDIALHQLMQSTAGTYVSSNGMGSLPLSMTQCSLLRTESAPFADSLQATMYVPIGQESYVSIMTMIQALSEDSCVMTATLPWDMPRRKQLHAPLLNTSDFTTTQIVTIEPVGIREVFDVQVERTENFIANGLVSHNTRWHEDDLAGRLLRANPGEWRVLRLPAIAESQEERDANNQRIGQPTGQPDPIGRAAGEALCPKRFSKQALAAIKVDVGTYVWYAQYGGSPRPPSGNRFQRSWFEIVQVVPAEFDAIVRYWDKAATAGGGAHTAGVLMARKGAIYYVLSVIRGQWNTGDREATIKQTAQLDKQQYGPKVATWIEQEPGSSGVDSAKATITNLSGYAIFAERPTGSKEVRAMPLEAQAQAGNVKLLQAPWNDAYLEELASFPNGTYLDQVDASSGAFNKIALAPKPTITTVSL